MRKLLQVYSQRKTSHWPSFRIVYEWEDIISRLMNLEIISDCVLWKKYYRRYEKNGITELYHMFLPNKPLRLDFLMEAQPLPSCRYNKNSIVIIIDFWLTDEDYPQFYKCFRHVPLLLLTNLEVFEFLKAHECPIPMAHWPLSYPDQYALNENVLDEKIYDFCLFGRPNPFFVRCQEKYAETHPNFSYIITTGTEKNREYRTNKGELICKDSGRESYLQMIRKTRVSCYTTPGIDEAKKVRAPFNQVTPRLFEMLCNGCSVIGHYPDSYDTRWYQLSDYIPNVNSYEEFEIVLERLLSEKFDYKKYEKFMSMHYTSSRVEMLKNILKNNEIQFP